MSRKLYFASKGQMQVGHLQQFLRNAINPFVGANFATGGTETNLAGEGNRSFLIAFRSDVTGIAALRTTTAHHLCDCFLPVSVLVSRYLFLPITTPHLPVVDEDLPEAVTAVLRGCMKQQSRRCSINGDGQHPLVGVDVDGSIADKVFGLLSVVLGL